MRNGFTLIELMVVLVIIAILAGMTIGVFLVARQQQGLEVAAGRLQTAVITARGHARQSGTRYALAFNNEEDTRHWFAIVPMPLGESAPLEITDQEQFRLPDNIEFQALSYKDADGNLWNTTAYSDKSTWTYNADTLTASPDAVKHTLIFTTSGLTGLVETPAGTYDDTTNEQTIAVRIIDAREKMARTVVNLATGDARVRLMEDSP